MTIDDICKAAYAELPYPNETYTTDLGDGWYANWTAGSLTIRNADRGQRIDLDAAQAAKLMRSASVDRRR